jgi:hypothetical protein
MTSDHLLALLIALRALPLRDSMTRAALLFALHGLDAKRKPTGVSVLWLADKLGGTVGSEVVRHHLRMLRSDRAVIVTGKNGKTELHALNPDFIKELDRLLRDAAIPL